MQVVRVTAPDLARRAALEKTRVRLLVAAGGFAILFFAVVLKLAAATVIFPLEPKHLERMARIPDPVPAASEQDPGQDATAEPPKDTGPRTRAMITDRNGEILAISLPTAGLYANPKEMIDPDEAAQKLKRALPRLDLDVIRARLKSEKQFVYLARGISPREELDINRLGIPGVYFQPTERRRYPQGRVAAQVLGGVDVDAKGVAGVEKYFDQRLR
ncbi:MAG: hypothetical protein JOZ05_16710 [Acetobacteraceae bacterium]|nr:hypothetical protein [Acetobacteraceae bacterium]